MGGGGRHLGILDPPIPPRTGAEINELPRLESLDAAMAAP
jgi:hypothetical protein